MSSSLLPLLVSAYHGAGLTLPNSVPGPFFAGRDWASGRALSDDALDLR